MHLIREGFLRLWNTVRPARGDRELEAELRLHVELAAADAEQHGLSPAEAARAARIRFGGVAQAMEEVRDRRALPWLSSAIRHGRSGLRALAQRPGATTASILSLALGLGVNAAIFSLTRELLLRPLPYPDADRLVRVFEMLPPARTNGPVTPANYFAWRDRVSAFERSTVFRRVSFNVSSNTAVIQVEGFQVDAAFFPLLGTVPALGRGFVQSDTAPGGDTVVLLADGLWRRRFDANPDVIGRSILVDGVPCTIVGVLPATFSIYRVLNRELELFRPLVLDPGDREHSLNVYAKLKSGASLDLARAQLTEAYASLPVRDEKWTAGVGLLAPSFAAKGKSLVLLLEWAAALVLLIACANIGNLLLTGWARRRKELALRQAFGGSRWRVALDVGSETLVVTAAGGVMALLLAAWIVAVLNASVSFEDIGRLHPFRVDGWVAAFTVGLTLVVTLGFTVLTAHAAGSVDVLEALKDASHGSTTGVGHRRLREMLLVGEVALSIVLTTAALALTRSTVRLHNLTRGFAEDRVMTAQLALNDPAYAVNRRLVDVMAIVHERLRTSSGVAAAALVNYPPLAPIRLGVPLSIDGMTATSTRDVPYARYWVVSPGYFETIKVPVLAGRDFAARDTSDGPGVAIVSASFARRFWGRTDVLGNRLTTNFPQSTAFWVPRARRTPLRVVGVVGDVREDGLPDAEGLPQLYLPYAQNPTVVVTLLARTTGGPASGAALSIREAVRAADPGLPVSNETSFGAMIQGTFAAPRSMAWLVGAFAALALSLSAVGIYGVMAYVTTARTREIGIRMALGATSADVLWLVIRRAALLTTMGITVGIGLTSMTQRLLKGLLFGVSPLDLTALVAVVVSLAAVALIASTIPAARVLRTAVGAIR